MTGPPAFWFHPPGVLSTLLTPASWIWRLGAALRVRRASPVKAPVPVLCIGNLTVGGAGKTPMAAALLARIAASGREVHLVSRGYGGRLTGPHRVDALRDSAADVGDEPLMLAQSAVVWIARDRAAGARAAAEAGAELVILDDGFQNPGLVKDASIVMVDAGQGFGNGAVVPAGPLRETIASGLARADLIVLVGDPVARATARARWPLLGSALDAELHPVRTGLDLNGQRVFAFAGIGRPEKFYDTLRSLGANLVATHDFPDHHTYSERVLERMVREARAAGALMLTTEKDAVKLPPAFRGEVMAVPVALVPDDWAAIDRVVADLIPE